jgi:hypothetical protein
LALTKVPLTLAVIQAVPALAEQEGVPRGLKIKNRTGQLLWDSAWTAGVDYNPDSFKPYTEEEQEEYDPQDDSDNKSESESDPKDLDEDFEEIDEEELEEIGRTTMSSQAIVPLVQPTTQAVEELTQDNNTREDDEAIAEHDDDHEDEDNKEVVSDEKEKDPNDLDDFPAQEQHADEPLLPPQQLCNLGTYDKGKGKYSTAYQLRTDNEPDSSVTRNN